MSDTPNAPTADGVLARELQRVNAESAKRRQTIKQLREQLAERDKAVNAFAAERQAWEAERTTLSADRDSWKTRYEAAPSELGQEVERLKGELRTGKHKEAFKGLYADADLGLNDKVQVDRLWQVLDYKADADAPDIDAVKAKILGLKESDPWLFRTPGGTPEAAPDGANGGQADRTKPQLPPGPGAQRGAAAPDAGWLTVKKSQTKDPEFMRLNQGRMADAVKEGRFRIVEG